jgi:hypothetical protein
VLGLGIDPDPAALLAPSRRTRRRTSSKVGDLEGAVELLRALGEGLLGAEGLDLREREVRGEPAPSATPSTIAERLRLANSGRAATSVVLVMLGSWRAIR